MIPGSSSFLPVYVEQSLTGQESIVFPIGTHTETMSLKYADFACLVQPISADFALSINLPVKLANLRTRHAIFQAEHQRR